MLHTGVNFISIQNKLQSVPIKPGILHFFMDFSLTLQIFSNLNIGCIYINMEYMCALPSSSQLETV